MIIRKATNKDAETLCRLDKLWFEEGISPYRNKPVTASEFRKKRRLIFIAEDKKPIGFVVGEIKTSPKTIKSLDLNKGEKYLAFQDLYVVVAYRKKGVGEKLAKTLIDEAKEQSVKKIRIVADSKKLASLVKFYKKLGAKQMWTRMKIDL